MPIIKPISALRNNAKEISALVHRSREPVFITKNGEGDMVVMSLAHYGEMERRLDLYAKLAAAQAEEASGAKARNLDDVMRDLRRRLGVSRD